MTLYDMLLVFMIICSCYTDNMFSLHVTAATVQVVSATGNFIKISPFTTKQISGDL